MLLKNLVETSLQNGVDRKTLKKLTKRFIEVNQSRLERTRAALPGRQRLFLDLLPLLLHVNHPMLPGYVTHQTPKGVTGYLPKKIDVLKARRISRSFTYKRQPTINSQIHSIFLMGSCGTIGQSDNSDIDLWICYPSDLPTNELAELRRKTDLISRWASQLGLEANFFLMDGEKFKLGHREALSGDNCGSSQHFLLLDEFYRTALLLAGRPPIWWLIPDKEEHDYDHYANMLRDKCHVRRDDTVDFGGIPDIPAGEFVGAGIWQLYKGIDSPHKSLLKLILLEAYATESGIQLSRQLKKMVYQGQLDIDELDPYIMIYRRLENYLTRRSDFKRLELVRQCLYIKTGKRLTARPSKGHASWQRKLMTRLVTEWGWSQSQMRDLDSRNEWKIERINQERKQLVSELLYSYRFLTQYARQHQISALINSQEMTTLGRKLYAAFERRAGKIEVINLGGTGKPAEEALSFCRVTQEETGAHYWAVYKNQLAGDETPGSPPVKTSQNLVELLGWCLLNGLIDEATLLDCREQTDGLRRYELEQYSKVLARLMAGEQSQIEGKTDEPFSREAQVARTALFINIATDPMAAMKQQGLQRLSNQTDSLGFSGLKDNLIINIEQISLNSWNETLAARYDGEEAITNCLKNYLATIPPDGNHAPPQLNVYCFCDSRASAITQRIEQLFRDFTACFYSGTRSPGCRYVIEIGDHYHVIQMQGGRPSSYVAQNLGALQRYLARPQSQYNPIVMDRYAAKNSVLPLITETDLPDTIQVFIQPDINGNNLFILDECGSLFFSQSQHTDQDALLNATHQFLSSVQYRQKLGYGRAGGNSSSTGQPSTNYGMCDISYYLIKQRDNSRKHYLELQHVDDLANGANFLNVQAIAEPDMDGQLSFNVYCDQQEFSQLTLGASFYSEIASYLLSCRSGHANYPCYITDLDIRSANTQNQSTIQYLRCKRQIERKLNAAIQLAE
jgi:adenylate cyclase class 1